MRGSLKRAVVMAFTILMGIFSVHAITCYCSSCSQCAADLSSSSCTKVVVTTDLTWGPTSISSCFGAQAVSNKILDCGGHVITATSPYAAVLSLNGNGNTIENCKFKDFANGIDVVGSYNTLLNLTFINYTDVSTTSANYSIRVHTLSSTTPVTSNKLKNIDITYKPITGVSTTLTPTLVKMGNSDYSQLDHIQLFQTSPIYPIEGIRLQYSDYVNISNIKATNIKDGIVGTGKGFRIVNVTGHNITLSLSEAIPFYATSYPKAILKNIIIADDAPDYFPVMLAIYSPGIEVENIKINSTSSSELIFAYVAHSSFSHLLLRGVGISFISIFGHIISNHIYIGPYGSTPPASCIYGNLIPDLFIYNLECDGFDDGDIPLTLGDNNQLINATYTMTSAYTSSIPTNTPTPQPMSLLTVYGSNVTVKNVVVHNDASLSTLQSLGYLFSIINTTADTYVDVSYTPPIIQNISLTNPANLLNAGINLTYPYGSGAKVNDNSLCYAKVGYYFGTSTTGITGTNNEGTVEDEGSNTGFTTTSTVCTKLLLTPFFVSPTNNSVVVSATLPAKVVINVTSYSPTLQNITVYLYNSTSGTLLSTLICKNTGTTLASPCVATYNLPAGSYYTQAKACDSSTCYSSNPINFIVQSSSSTSGSSSTTPSGSSSSTSSGTSTSTSTTTTQECSLVLLVHNHLSQMISITSVQVESEKFSLSAPVNIMPESSSQVVVKSPDLCVYYGRVAFVHLTIWYKTADGLLHEISGELALNG